MSTAPSLALRSLLTRVLRETGLLSPLQRISGATPPVRGLAVAAAAKRLSDTTILLVVPTDAEIENAVGDVAFFLSMLEGSAATIVERQVLPFPSTQVDPYRGFQPHLKVAAARARVLHALATRGRSDGASASRADVRVVVASAGALLTKVPEPASLLLASHEITPGIDIDPHELANLLVLGGYEPADPVDAHGEFSRRGNIFDVFPAGDELPIRIEFVGDTVESIRRFDPGTQRSVETLDRFGIIPVRADYARGLAPNVADDYVGGQPPSVATLFHFLRTRDAQVWLSEPTDVENHIKSAWEQIATSYSDAVERARVEPPPPADLLVTEDELAAELANAVVVEELAIGDEGESEDSPLQLSVQPTAVFHGRIPDWVNDVKTAQANGDHIIFVAGSHGRAERAIELLKDYDVRAVMGADAGDYLGGAVVVAEGWLSKGFRFRFGDEQAQAPSPISVSRLRRDRCLRRGASEDRSG